MKFIKGLPIVKQILEAIDFLVGKILKPVTDKIEKWVKEAINLPEFPGFNKDKLPFGAFNDIPIKMPGKQRVGGAITRTPDRCELHANLLCQR